MNSKPLVFILLLLSGPAFGELIKQAATGIGVSVDKDGEVLVISSVDCEYESGKLDQLVENCTGSVAHHSVDKIKDTKKAAQLASRIKSLGEQSRQKLAREFYEKIKVKSSLKKSGELRFSAQEFLGFIENFTPVSEVDEKASAEKKKKMLESFDVIMDDKVNDAR